MNDALKKWEQEQEAEERAERLAKSILGCLIILFCLAVIALVAGGAFWLFTH